MNDLLAGFVAVFDAQPQQYEQQDYNGCAFIAASTEAPSGGLVEHDADRFRAWIRAIFTDLAGQAGAPDPVSLGRQLHLIYDGAREAVQALLDSALATQAAGRPSDADWTSFPS